MTEIAWLVQFIMKHKISDEAKEACIARIGEVESSIASRPTPTVQPLPVHRPISQAQLQDMQGEGGATAIVPPLTQRPLPPPLVGAIPHKVEVHTGNGTRGPRKF